MAKKRKRNDDGMVFSTNSNFNFDDDHYEDDDNWSPSCSKELEFNVLLDGRGNVLLMV